MPAAAWLLLRIRKYGAADPVALASHPTLPLPVLAAAVRQVEERRLAVRQGLPLVLTRQGHQVAERLQSAREACLAELLGDWWRPDRPTDLTELVRHLSEELCGADQERPAKGTPRRQRRSVR